MTWTGRTAVRHDGRMVQLGETLVPQRAKFEITGEDECPDGRVTFEVRDGRPECVEIAVKAKPGGRGIQSADMTLFNIDNLTVNVFSSVALGPVQQVGPGEWAADNSPDDRAAWSRRGDVHRARTTRRASAGDRVELERVAKVYREHLANAPIAAVRVLLGYHSDRTAARRVQQARAAGLLPPTTPGKRKG